jgi:hypothetical protein
MIILFKINVNFSQKIFFEELTLIKRGGRVYREIKINSLLNTYQ